MKRAMMGVVWFFVLSIVFSMIGGFVSGVSGHTDPEAPKYMDLVVLLALAVAVVGTALGIFPGTKKKNG